MTKVFVGMSGGVDSSVTSALLKERGFNVTGVYMKNWTKDIGGNTCPWRQDLADAKRVAVQLDIPFKIFDFQKEYKQSVVDYMLAEYARGNTPNPDIMCNQEVKFKLFLHTALEAGADMIATGHYARIKDGQLFTGLDSTKDQSYFLYRTTKEALGKTLMPIGEFKKSVVRAKAKDLGLVTATKPDSQGICFVGEVSIADFINEFMPLKSGPIKDKKTDKVLGQHDGAVLYTVGQRHGLGLGGGLPFYVTSTDVKSNTVYVTTQLDDESLWCDNINLGQVHWIDQAPDFKEEYSCLVRYRSQPVKCKLNLIGNNLRVVFNKSQRALARGQSVVIYRQNQVLGGGIII